MQNLSSCCLSQCWPIVNKIPWLCLPYKSIFHINLFLKKKKKRFSIAKGLHCKIQQHVFMQLNLWRVISLSIITISWFYCYNFSSFCCKCFLIPTSVFGPETNNFFKSTCDIKSSTTDPILFCGILDKSNLVLFSVFLTKIIHIYVIYFCHISVFLIIYCDLHQVCTFLYHQLQT